jgi:hypothetical protein
MSGNHRFDVAALAAITQRWVTAFSRDDAEEAQRLAMQAIDSLLGTFGSDDFTRPAATALDPGIYFTLPQGHTLIVDATREAVVLDMGGVVSIAGVDITDWDQLARLGQHLVFLADRKRPAADPGSHDPRP